MKDQADSLRKAIERLGAVHIADPAVEFLEKRGSGLSRVITVAGGKSGVGKTSVSVNLALALCELKYKTLLIDADIGIDNAEACFGIIPGCGLYDVINNAKTSREVIRDGPGGVKIISGGSGLEAFIRMEGSQTAAFISEMSELDDEFDVIIIDAGAGISDTVLSITTAADDAIIVATPEPSALTDAYALIKAMAARERENRIRILVNRASAKREADEIMTKLASTVDKFLDLKIHKLGYMLYDPLVVRSIKLQLPFFIESPYSQTSNRIREIALRLMDVTEFANIGKVRGMSGFLDRVAKFINIQFK